MTGATPTPRADQIAAKWGKSHPLYAQMRALDLEAAADAAALARGLSPKPLICVQCDDDLTRDGAGVLRDSHGSGECSGLDDGRPHQSEWYYRPICHCGTLPHPRGAAVGCVHWDEG